MTIENILQTTLNKMAPQGILNSSEVIRKKNDEIEKLFKQNLDLTYTIKELKEKLKSEQQAEVKRNRITVSIILGQVAIIIWLILKLFKV
jgi:GTPase SAR1 family protein